MLSRHSIRTEVTESRDDSEIDEVNRKQARALQELIMHKIMVEDGKNTLLVDNSWLRKLTKDEVMTWDYDENSLILVKAAKVVRCDIFARVRILQRRPVRGKSGG